MKFSFSIIGIGVAGAFASSGLVAMGGEAFFGAAPDEHHPWAVHDRNRPVPRVVSPGTSSSQEQPGKPPSDAVVLFDGSDLSKWQAGEGKGEPTKWIIKDGAMECVPGSGGTCTREPIGDCQLHLEWASPIKVQGEGQGRGNSGVFLMGMEIQVLDNYNNPTYADGYAGAVYATSPPLVNALRPPGQFQTYDIFFRRPVYKDGKVLDAGYVTVLENGVLVQDHTTIEGTTSWKTRSKPESFAEKACLGLQDHNNPVRYRNIWYRPLPPRAVEGGTDGWLSSEATSVKRKEIAASIRQDAQAIKDPVNQLLRLSESLIYEKDTQALQQVQSLSAQYIASFKQISVGALASKKDEVKRVNEAFEYLALWKIIPESFEPKVEIEQMVRNLHAKP